MTTNNKKRKGRPSSDEITFPNKLLKKCIELATTISDKYGGQPTNPSYIANEMNLSFNGREFRDTVTASHKYGITDGSYQAKVISLTKLGKKIVEPTDENERDAAILQALKTPDLFNKVLSTYNGKKPPCNNYLQNALKNIFCVSNTRVTKCADIITANINDYKLLDETGILRIQNLQTKNSSDNNKHSDIEETKEQSKINFEESDIDNKNTSKQTENNQEELPRVFISHSKNTKILEQIKGVLDFGNFTYNIAIEEETTAIPIPEKVFELMRNCNCAIINVSADEQEKREDGSYEINQNVLIEIGAAFLLYNKRIILLVDKRVKLPSNIQGLHRSQYEGENLTWDDGIKLQKALSQFRQLDSMNKTDTNQD